MKWRCPECGKPHERNDPPCDNCGHHKFERAVVPQATSDPDHEQFVWACTNCGRHHQRNNPPCSRCGNSKFEKKPLDYGDFDTGATSSYLALAGRLEVGAILVIVALLAIGVLGFFGVVTVPGITPQGPPTVGDVPGNDSVVGDVSLTSVETSVFATLNVDREPPLERSDGLDAIATYTNQRVVKNRYTEQDRPLDSEQLERFDVPCSGLPELRQARTSEPVGSPATAESLATALSSQFQSSLSSGSITSIGIDAHAGPDDRVFVVVAYC